MKKHNELERKILEIEDLAWRRLFHDDTNLFYDFISSYDADDRFKHLPTNDEILRHVPNPNGWGTGMEDSVINGGVVLNMLCDKFDVTGDETVGEAAGKVFDGLVLCAEISGEDGFLARSVSPFDGRSHYTETSRDQITHFMHALWRFSLSPLASTARRSKMAELVDALCRRLERNVVSANDYHFLSEDGKRGLVDKMWNVASHESTRLPLCYAVAATATGDSHWQRLYEKYAVAALLQSSNINLESYDLCYALFQHQVSMEVLAWKAWKDGNSDLSRKWKLLMRSLAEASFSFYDRFKDWRSVDVTSVNMDWRSRPQREGWDMKLCGHVPVWPVEMYKHSFNPIREPAEALLMAGMLEERQIGQDELKMLERLILEPEYGMMFTYAMLYPPAAYWRFRKKMGIA